MNNFRIVITLILTTIARFNGFANGFVSPLVDWKQSVHVQNKRISNNKLSLSAESSDRMSLKNGGSFCALVTPFEPTTGAIDFTALRQLLQYHLENSSDGLCVLGTTAEASVLSMAERESVLKVAVEELKGKIPILVGTGTINPNSVRAQTLQAMDMGCDASMVVTPYYVKPPQRALVQHFTSAADLGLPVIMYNVPGRTGVDLSPHTVALCAAEHENIIGVKEATGKVERGTQIRELVHESRPEFLLFSGDDATELDFILNGSGNGCISVTANVAPKLMHDMIAFAKNPDNKQDAIACNEKLKLLHNNLFKESNPIPTKWALKRMGLIPSEYCRPPLCTLDEKFYGDVEDALLAAGLL